MSQLCYYAQTFGYRITYPEQKNYITVSQFELSNCNVVREKRIKLDNIVQLTTCNQG